jgi:hypothetical protein
MPVTRQGGKSWWSATWPKAAGGNFAANPTRDKIPSGNDLAAQPGRPPQLSGNHSPSLSRNMSHGYEKIQNIF